MKKLLILTLSFVMLSAYAQNGKYNPAQKGQDFKGYLVTEKKDTIKGTLRIFEMWQMQMGPALSPDDKSLGPQNFNYLNTICYVAENKTKWYSTKFVNLKAPADPKRPLGANAETFLLAVESGPITLFDYDFMDESVTPLKEEIKSYMQLPNGEVVDVSSLLLGFPKKMSGYVKDFPELAKKITDKEKGYGMLGLNAIVREYNTWYMAKNPGFTLMK